MIERARIRLKENFRYRLADEAAIEDFEDGSLIFLCFQQRMIELNPIARRIVGLMDGSRNLAQIIKTMSHKYELNNNKIGKDVHKLVIDLSSQGAIKPLVRVAIRLKQYLDRSTSLFVNPNASLRSENDEGAILFNTDTNVSLSINATGLVIWRFLKVHPRSITDIVAHLRIACEGTPQFRVGAEVERFIGELHGRGFIGQALDEKKFCRSENSHKKCKPTNRPHLSRSKSVLLHASSNNISGTALVFLGHSSAGKSTISRLLSKRYPVIADDNVYVYKDKDGKWLICNGADVSPFKEGAELSQGSPNKYLLSAVLRIFKSDSLRISSLSSKETCRYLMDAVFEIDMQKRQKNLETIKKWFTLTAELSREIQGSRLAFKKDKNTIDFIRSSFDNI